MNRFRTALAAVTAAIAVAGAVYGLWAVLYAIINASLLTQFIIAVAAAGAGIAGVVASLRE